jgi:succinoglycan biosynthesis protein ExoA
MQLVSVIIPCYNEQKTIRFLLDSIVSQTYPREYIEVIIADGLSTDNTRSEIEEFINTIPDLKILVVENSKRSIPSGLNQAIRASQGDIIVRIDAHSIPYPDYIEKCVEALTANLGENVGGIWEILPADKTWMALSIAKAAGMRIAVGDALYRHAKRPAYVETVPFGAFKRELLALIGFFDETLLSNEDYEFNARILASGGKIWLDPAIRSNYIARATLSKVASQYWRYGYWKYKMLKRYPKTLRWRQALPPLFVCSLVLGVLIAIIFQGPFWSVPVGELLLYMVLLIVASIKIIVMERNPLLVIGIPLAIATMHISWGLGFISSFFSVNPTKLQV